MGSPSITSSLASVFAVTEMPSPSRLKMARSPSRAARSPFTVTSPVNMRNVVVWPWGSGRSAVFPAWRFTSHTLIGVKVFAAPLCPLYSPAMTRTAWQMLQQEQPQTLIQSFPHFARQRSVRVRLLKEDDAWSQYPALTDGVFGISRRKQDPRLRIRFLKCICHFFAAHDRHHDICQHEVNSSILLTRCAQPVLAVERLENSVAFFAQGESSKFADSRGVLNQKHRFAASGHVGGGDMSARGFNFQLHQGEINPESRALSDFTTDGDMATVLLDDSEAGRETQARSFARRFGGKKWFKEVRFDLVAHADAGIGNRQHNVIARAQLWKTPQVVLVQHGIGSHNGEFSAIRHGIPGVDREVHNNLLDLARVGFDMPCSRIKFRVKLDVFTDQPAQHFFHLSNDVI